MEGYSPEATVRVEAVESVGYDRERVAAQALVEARQLIEARGFNELSAPERHASIINLMEELAADNANRHKVEALAAMLKLEDERAAIAEQQAAVHALSQQLGWA